MKRTTQQDLEQLFRLSLDLQLPEMTGEAVLRELWRDVAHE